LVGIILNWWLFGILLMQYFVYCNHAANRDNKFLRSIVHILFILDTIQTIMTMVDAFNWFVYNFGNYEAMLDFGIASIDSPFMDGLIAFIVQLVYCWRVRVLSQWRVLPAIIAFLAFVGGVSGMVVGIYDGIIRTVLNVNPGFYVPVMLWLWGSVVTDILIVASMSYLLVKLRHQHASRNVMVVMKRLVILTLETNLLTTAVAMATVIMFVITPIGPPFTNIHLTGGYILGKLYSNCFMVLLNQRLYYENATQSRSITEELGSLGTYSLSDRGMRSGPGAGGQAHSNPNAIGEISAMHFAEPPTRVDLKSKANDDDVELGRFKQGY
ncbi:hypothetical protein P691DRAFT_667915, partial [Macrolepiota fuliginosa MF-IS2]